MFVYKTGVSAEADVGIDYDVLASVLSATESGILYV